MFAEIPKHVREIYDVAGVLARAATAPSLRLSLVELESLKLTDFHVSVRESYTTDDGETVERIIFNHSEARGTRVLVDVRRCESAMEAAYALLSTIAGNQMRLVDRGAGELGFAVFEQGSDVSPALYFAQGQFCVTVANFGVLRVEILTWAQRVVQVLKGADTPRPS